MQLRERSKHSCKTKAATAGMRIPLAHLLGSWLPRGGRREVAGVGGEGPREAWSGRRRPQSSRTSSSAAGRASTSSSTRRILDLHRAAHDPCSARAGSRELRPCSRRRGGRGRRRQRGATHGHVLRKGRPWIQRHRTTSAPQIHRFTFAAPTPATASAIADPGSPAPPGSRLAVVEGWGRRRRRASRRRATAVASTPTSSSWISSPSHPCRRRRS
jgi:hypothetical protein